MTKATTALIYHPNKILLQSLSRLFEAAGYVTSGTTDETEAITVVREMKPTMFLVAPLIETDLAVAQEVHAKYPWTKVIVLAETEEMVEHAKDIGLEYVLVQGGDYYRFAS